MDTVREIRSHFATLYNPGALDINTLPEEYPAYVIRTSSGYGVAIEADKSLEVSERFNSVRLHTEVMTIEGYTSNYLILKSAFEEYRYEFATLCAEFVEPGEAGKNRTSVLSDPIGWWNKWKELVGNASKEQRVYNVIAEMLVLDHKFRDDKSSVWAATRMSSHDIECAEESCEVKSTIKKTGAEIVISSQHQLEHEKRLFLYFCRMEESREGLSINDAKKMLVSHGYDENKIEIELERQGFEKGSSIRDKKYKVLEKRKYEVNESFPRIVRESFKGNQYPSGITHIEYTVDLNILKYENW